ncbi:zinc metallopeptidase [bacterium]|nr:zinc metallopeptidase [bacterium]
MFFLSPLYILLVGPALILAIWAQMKVKSAFAKYSKVGNSSGMSGAEAAAEMLRGLNIRVVGSKEQAKSMDNAVAIERVGGFLTDHYDPRSKVLRLSPKVHDGRSLASVGVACHEAGHALQHANGYAPLEIRSLMVPVASFGSWAAFPVIILGALLHAPGLVGIGILVFAVVVLFQLVTLPVEFDASNRAKLAVTQFGIVQTRDESKGVAAVLNAAAWTYVAAAAASIMTLIYYVMILTGGSRR